MALPLGRCIGYYTATVDPDAGGYTAFPRAVWISWSHYFALRDTLRNFADQDRLPPQAMNGVKQAIKSQLLGAANADFVQSESDDWFLLAVQQLTDEPPTLDWIQRRLLA